MFKLMKFFRWYDWLIVLLIVASTIGRAYIELMLPEYMGAIIGVLTTPGVVATKALVLEKGGIMVGIAFASVVLTIFDSYLAAYISSNLAKNVRKALFTKVGNFSMEEVHKFSTPSLITRSTNDVTQIQQTMAIMLRMMLFAPTMAVMALIKIVNLSGPLTVATGVSVGCMVALVLFTIIAIVPKFSKLQKQTDKLNGVARENLTGIRVVRAYGAENVEEEKFEDTNTKLTKTTLFTNRVTALLMPGMTLIINGMTLAILWIGAYLLNAGSTDYSVITQFSQYAMHVLMSFLFVSILFIMLPRGAVSARRINEVLSTTTKITDGEYIPQESDLHGVVEFKNVSFKYPDADGYVLKNISFKAEKGQTVAFIGSTGSGKSTLINLIPRFYDATEGEVLVDGVNVKEYRLHDLNEKIGYVPQKGLLFSGTVDDNIKVGKTDADDDEIKRALKVSQSSSFVSKLQDKRDYRISQGGKNVSGGQRQRLSIARAIVKQPEMYIFDDSFSALDYKTDKALREALKQEMNGVTNLIVAQRIGTIMDADKILVLENGEVVGEGTHKELMKSCKVYQEIAYSQLSKEELR